MNEKGWKRMKIEWKGIKKVENWIKWDKNRWKLNKMGWKRMKTDENGWKKYKKDEKEWR